MSVKSQSRPDSLGVDISRAAVVCVAAGDGDGLGGGAVVTGAGDGVGGGAAGTGAGGGLGVGAVAAVGVSGRGAVAAGATPIKRLCASESRPSTSPTRRTSNRTACGSPRALTRTK